MHHHNTSALSRPRHLFDLPAISAIALASAGRAAIELAHAIDDRRTTEWHDARRHRPSGAVAPHTREMLPETWRIR